MKFIILSFLISLSASCFAETTYKISNTEDDMAICEADNSGELYSGITDSGGIYDDLDLIGLNSDNYIEAQLWDNDYMGLFDILEDESIINKYPEISTAFEAWKIENCQEFLNR